MGSSPPSYPPAARLLAILAEDTKTDRLFEHGPYPVPFSFNADVAEVFDDMVARSVPLYHEALSLVAEWSLAHLGAGERLIDLGCSTGSFLRLIGELVPHACRLEGVDTSQAMIEKAKGKLTGLEERHSIHLHECSALEVDYSDTQVVTMQYTLQFLPVRQRQELINRIYDGLKPGGLLLISDKLRAGDRVLQETQTRIYEHFKAAQGYSKNEIERKKEALDQVLIPFTEEEEDTLLRNAGFKVIMPLIRWQQFATFVARKQETHERGADDAGKR